MSGYTEIESYPTSGHVVHDIMSDIVVFFLPVLVFLLLLLLLLLPFQC
jgi:hypothetical protein